MLLTIGSGAATAPLGAGFDGFLPGVVRFVDASADAGDPKRCAFFGAAADSLANLHVQKRAVLDKSVGDGADVSCVFTDGAPLLVHREMGRGALFVLTLPFTLDDSDFVVRPAFLTLLDRFTEEARAHGGANRVDVGIDFTFGGAKKVEGVFQPLDGSAALPVSIFDQRGVLHATPSVTGRYVVDADGTRETRFAVVPEGEVDLRPRAIAPRSHDASLGGKAPRVDISKYVAIALLALMALELAARVVMRLTKAKPPTPSEPAEPAQA